ncbi:MAG: oxygen-independent coproporphyrinogen III oxidase [Thalassobius sp.]|nr:oxygen-independent coproporphyrinogen III oxidase [Thalassovita sp.]
MLQNLVQKYNIPGPRYTSYPTVPYWEENQFTRNEWISCVQKSFIESNDTEGISLYIHLPFCESMCTFCGCNKRITKNHLVENVYINAVLKEWELYCNYFHKKPKIKEIHLGGGTPTFFSPENLQLLIDGIFEKAEKFDNESYFSFEGHPNNTTYEHLKKLYDLGFRRVSYGIQDFDPHVQNLINRVQSFENVKRVTEQAREIGYTSVNFDIIYGLPQQKLSSVINTMDLVNQLRPDRIAYYSYAHVPWIKGLGQRKFTEDDLPSPQLKQELYETGKNLLKENGYLEIGMDHFAIEHDSLWTSLQNKTLHRNFMGYSDSKTQMMIGLGVSSISDSWTAFAQNEKKLEDYYQAIKENRIPVFRGHILSDEDLIVRKHILNLMCQLETKWQAGEFGECEIDILSRLATYEEDDLIELNGNELKVTKEGKAFIRNICMAFDLKLWRKKPTTKLFSMTI